MVVFKKLTIAFLSLLITLFSGFIFIIVSGYLNDAWGGEYDIALKQAQVAAYKQSGLEDIVKKSENLFENNTGLKGVIGAGVLTYRTYRTKSIDFRNVSNPINEDLKHNFSISQERVFVTTNWNF